MKTRTVIVCAVVAALAAAFTGCKGKSAAASAVVGGEISTLSSGR